MDSKKFFVKRFLMMFTGILFISICVGCYRLSGFGVDAFTCMNLGISGFLNMMFGTWQLIMNVVILIAVFFTVRKCIGVGTVVNMVCVGYGADFICWMAQDVFEIEMTLLLQISALVMGSLFAGLGVALYMEADMGIAGDRNRILPGCGRRSLDDRRDRDCHQRMFQWTADPVLPCSRSSPTAVRQTGWREREF